MHKRKNILVLVVPVAIVSLFFAFFVAQPNVHAVAAGCDYAYSADKSKITENCPTTTARGQFIPASKLIYSKTKANTYEKKTSFKANNKTVSCTATLKIGSNPSKGTISGKVAPLATSPGSSMFSAKCNKQAKLTVKSIDVSTSNDGKQTKAANDVITERLKSLIKKRCSSLPSAGETVNCTISWPRWIAACSSQSGSGIGKASLILVGPAYTEQVAGCLSTKSGVAKATIAKALGNDLSTAVTKAVADTKLDRPSCKKGETLDPDTNVCVSEETDKESCTVKGVGWIVCPTLTFMGAITDKAWEAVNGFLKFDVSILKAPSLKLAWDSFRNIANVLFVIFFLIIIYSQMTGFGVSNYGIKRLLPKIIIAVILVNVSFYVCTIAVDVSNILGATLKDFISNLSSGSITNNDGLKVQKIGGHGVTWSALIVVALASALLLLVVFLSVPVLLAALLAIGMIIIILLVRKALILLLIVISPLAFIAYLLPNTEQWFKRWLKLFWALLLLYPIVAVVFGASELAANIIVNAGGGSGTSESAMTIQLTALGVAAVPLFVVPSLLKNALSGTGALGAKLSGLQTAANRRVSGRASKTASDRVKPKVERFNQRRQAKNIKRANDIRDGEKYSGISGEAGSRRRRTMAALGGFGATTAIDSKKKDEYAKIAADTAERNYVGQRSEDEAYASSLAGKGNEAMVSNIQAYGSQAVRQAEEEDIKAERSRESNKNIPSTQDELSASMRDAKGDKSHRAAASAEIASRGGGEHAQAALDAMGAMSDVTDDDKKARRMVQSQFINNLATDQLGLSAEDKTQLGEGKYKGKYDDKIADRAERKMSGEVLAGLQPHDNKKLAQLAAAGKLNDDALASLSSAIADTRSNTNISSKVKEDAKGYHAIIEKAASARGISAQPKPGGSSGGGSPGSSGSGGPGSFNLP